MKLKSIKFCLVLILPSIVLISCFASPAYWNAYSNSEAISKLDPDNPEAAKKGWEDGCRSGVVHWRLPTQVRSLNEFIIDPYYANDPIYRDAWNTATYYCMGRIRNSIFRKYLETYNMLDQRGDSIAYKR